MIRKIYFVESTSGMGGVEYSTLYLAKKLDRSYWKPLVICPAEGDLPRSCRQAGVPVVILPLPPMRSTSLRFGIDHRLPNPLAWGWNLIFLWVATLRLRRFLRQHPVDLVVTKGMSAHFYGGMAACIASIPCIWHVQDFISERFGGLYRQFFGLIACLLPTHIIVDGTPIARQFPAVIQERVSVVFNGVDTGIFRPGLDGSPVREELGLPLDALVIGNVARLTPWKGQHYLLEAFARLASEFPNAYLLLVGSPVFDTDGYKRLLKDRTRQFRLEGRVIFAGYRHDLPQVLAAMDIFAYTATEKDTSPLALLSAMAVGLPVVAFDIEGVREVVAQTGDLTTVSESGPLSKVLRQLMKNQAQRLVLAQTSRTRAEKLFGLDVYISSMQKIFYQNISN